jgi:8-oxo-dGTP pyrophosphatase MutT (NUDIX family)
MAKSLKNRKWSVLSSEYLLREGAWCTVRRDTVQLPTGVVIPEWYVFEFPSWANVIALTKEGKMVLVSQYRHGLGETHYELCAGLVDPTDPSPMEGAKRELEEETGYGGGRWSLYMTTSANPSNHNNLNYTFLAEDVELITERHPEESEDLEVHLLTKIEVRELLERGEMIQAMHAAPLWRFFAEEKK